MALKPRNITLKLFREYLTSKGLKIIRIKGGHEIWGGHCVKRPIVLQSHIDPVPEFIVKQSLKTLNVEFDDFIDFLKN
jgi:hypothetical protein